MLQSAEWEYLSHVGDLIVIENEHFKHGASFRKVLSFDWLDKVVRNIQGRDVLKEKS